jgi:carbonic anhydrase
MTKSIDADKALEYLLLGNLDYIDAKTNHHGDISHEKRMHLHNHGQNPYALVVCCSDSRVVPENIFMKGLGDIFVIRLAGNVLGDFAMGSIEYGIEHLGIKLVLVMGHSGCGAVHAALEGSHDHYIGLITKEIQNAIKDETSPLVACKKNVLYQINKIKNSPILKDDLDKVKIVGAIYHTHSGKVEILK